jgi:parvulin-like peptidyl-prolyl isomerase
VGTRIVLFSCAAAAASALAGCGALSSSPSWVGGGLAVEAPMRHAEDDAKAEAERKRVAAQPTQVGAKHILIMWEGSKSRPDNMTRSRADARKRAEEVLAKARAGTPFEELVKEYTEEPGGAERGGDLGVFDRTSMVRAFSEAAFNLKVGEISDVVETQFGFHIIKRTE